MLRNKRICEMFIHKNFPMSLEIFKPEKSTDPDMNTFIHKLLIF